MTRQRPSQLLAMVVAGLLVALPGQGGRNSSACADEGPIIIGQRERPSYLTLDPFHGSIGFQGLYQYQSSTNHGQTANNSTTLLTPSLTLNTGGTVISSNLMHWTGTATLLLEDQQSSGTGATGTTLGVNDTYDFEAQFLGKTPFPVSAFATRSQNIINRPFAALLQGTSTSYGTTFRYDSPTMPSSLTIGHTTTDQSDEGGSTQYSTDVNELQAQTSVQPFERHQFTFNYSLADQTQNNPGVLNDHSIAQNFGVSHTWGIDPAGNWVLSQGFDYSSQSGQFPFTRTDLTEELQARLTDTLNSTFGYRLDRETDANSQQTQQSFNASVTHHLYESLTTTARMGALFSDRSFSGAAANTSNSSSRNFFANIGTSYSKNLFQGRLGADLSIGYIQNDNGPVGQIQDVLNDIHSFMDPQPIILTRPGLNSSSVAVFNAAGTRQYIQGIDYTVQTIGNTVQVFRQVGGNIQDGDSVRLNYQIDPLPGYTSRSTSLNIGVNYRFNEGPLNGLYLFARYSQVDQSISPASSEITADNVRDTVFGAEYPIWKLTLRAEYEMNDSTLAAYNAQRFSVTYTDRIGDATTLSFSATENVISYPQEATHTNFTTVNGRLEYQIMRDVRAALSANWRNQEDARLGNSMGFEEQAELRWKIRQTDLSFMLRHTDLHASGGHTTSVYFMVGINRNF